LRDAGHGIVAAWLDGAEDAFVHIGDDLSYKPDRRAQRVRYHAERHGVGKALYSAYDRVPPPLRDRVTALAQRLNR
jgi:hypothetical protein